MSPIARIRPLTKILLSVRCDAPSSQSPRTRPPKPRTRPGVVLSLSKQTIPPSPKRLSFAHRPFAEGSWFSFVDGFPPPTRLPKPRTRRRDKQARPARSDSHLHIIYSFTLAPGVSAGVRGFSFVDGFPPRTRPPKPTIRRRDKPTHPEAVGLSLSKPLRFAHRPFAHSWFSFVDGFPSRTRSP